MRLSEIITGPILTEKTYQQMEQGIYSFTVDKRAHKLEIAKAVEMIFKVKVSRVNTINVSKKPKKLGRFAGFLPAYKKAIVHLSEGIINFFPEDEEVKKPVKKAKKEITEAEKKAVAKIEAKAKETKKTNK